METTANITDAEKAYNKKLGAFKRSCKSLLKNKGLRHLELTKLTILEQGVRTYKDINVHDAVEILDATMNKYKENLVNG